MMYYLLNYAPSILLIILSATAVEIDFSVYAITYLFVQPIYLLFVNMVFICKKTISYANGIMYMASVLVFNVTYTIILHKIETDYFLGDVPIEIYFFMICIPMIVILLGTGILYLFKGR